MNTYTVVVEASDAAGKLWQAMAPAENVAADDARDLALDAADDVAEWVATNQTIATGGNWRVRVWDGADADTALPPAAEVYALEAG